MRDRIADELPHLRRFARGLARDATVADDLVQDCVERALAQAQMFDNTRSLRTWLFTILRNVFIDNIRSQKARSALLTAHSEDHGLTALAASQFNTVLTRQVLAAVDNLAIEQREVLLLVAVEGLSYRETADVIGAPLGTVMSRLSRAREQLRLLIEDGRVTSGPRDQIRRLK